MKGSPSGLISVCMNILKESCTSSGVNPYSRSASARMSWQDEQGFVERAGATWKQRIVTACRILKNIHDGPLARGRRPQEVPLGKVQAVDDAGASGVQELLVVVQIEAVEVGALSAFDLLHPYYLTTQKLNGFAGARLHDEFTDDASLVHGRYLLRFWPALRRRMGGDEFVQGPPDQGRAIGCVAPRDGFVEQLCLLLINDNDDLMLGH